ncbi:MAG: hypothetical protein KAW52_06985 [candidate division Zixibacteria bacterium]|nr:hypothetical protein [candidate division Zixibacteria bacterium]
MTICIGAICEQSSSLILATDSMLTNEGLSIQFEHPTKKMTSLSDSCIALTAGDALAHTELFNMVQDEITKLKAPSVLEIVDKIKECYQRIREKEIKEKILIPKGFNDFKDFYEAQRVLIPDVALTIQSQIERYDYGLEILVAGISGEVTHIYGISDPGTSKCLDAIGFHAIGSGLPHAVNTLIARGCYQGTALKEALLIVYEAKKMAEKAPGVGANITDMCIMDPQGITEFPHDKFGELHKIYEKWARREPNWASDLDIFLKEIGGSKK